MKRNTMFMLVLTLIVGTMGLFFIGCDDTTVESPQIERDIVHGSFHGTVVNSYDNAFLANVTVYYWASGDGTGKAVAPTQNAQTPDERDSVTTGSNGEFRIPGPLASGWYELEFVVSSFAVTRTTAYIPTIEELKGDIDNNPSGVYEVEITVGDSNGRSYLYPLTATVTGKIFSALPDDDKTSSKENGSGEALQVHPQPVSEVEVVLTFPISTIHPNRYVENTNSSGVYTFANVPAYEGPVNLSILPFTAGDSSYLQFDTTIYMGEALVTQVPDIYGIVDCRSVPSVLSRSFLTDTRFHYDSSLVLYFSEPMDTVTFVYELRVQGSGDIVQTTYTWSANDSILTIDPILTLLTDTWYELDIDHAESKSGCQLKNIFNSLPFQTLDGIQLQSTNVERAPLVFNDFPINDNINLTFNMPPVIDPLYGTLTLTDRTGGSSFPVAFDSSVSGNVLTVNPKNPLERSHTYEICYGVFSSIPGDFHDSCITFSTEIDTIPPGAVSGWALNEPFGWRADWNTTEVMFRWNTLPAAAGYGYKIYAKDNNRNTDFIEIWDVSSQDYLQFQETEVELPSQFDLFLDDGMQTPFSGGTVIEFAIRAYNAAGLGPFSSSIFVQDETPPGGGDGTNDDFEFYQIHGSADNTPGTVEDTVWIGLGEQVEYMQRTNNPTFNFVEGGGDESYSLPNSVGHWEWNNSGRMEDYLKAWFTVPAGQCGAGDYLELTFYDNSGNDTTIMYRIRPYIVFNEPDPGDTVEAPNYAVNFTVYQAPISGDPTLSDNAVRQIDMVDYFLTLDGTTAFVDTTEDFRSVSGNSTYNVTSSLENTWFSDNLARVALQDTIGGCYWYSGNFTVAGLDWTDIDAVQGWDDSTVYDRNNTDSTAIPLAWNSAGLDSVVIWYTDDDSISSWIKDTTIANTGSFDWYPPNLGYDYRTWIRISDFDGGNHQPLIYTMTGIDVTHDTIDFTFPTAGADLAGGADTNVTWDLVGDSAQDIILQVNSDDPNVDSLWFAIDTVPNNGTYTASIPEDEPASSNWMRFRDINDSNTLAIVGPFSISGVTVTAPNGGEAWLVGSSQLITWDAVNAGAIGNVHIYLSTDDFVTYDTLTPVPGGTPNTGSFNWNVLNRPSTSAKIRIVGENHAVVDESDTTFTIQGVTVTAPNGGENLAVGATFQITWNTVDIVEIDSVDIQYSVDGGGWVNIATVANTGSHNWTVPNDPSLNVIIRVKKAGTLTGADVSDNPFTISGIIISDPNGGETVTVGTGLSYTITWSKVSQVSTVEIHYSLNGTGGPWFLVPGAGSVNPDDETFTWDTDPAHDPNLPATNQANCFIRIKEVVGTIEDNSDSAFDMLVP